MIDLERSMEIYSVGHCFRRVNMLDIIPNEAELTALVGTELYDVWSKLCTSLDEKYDKQGKLFKRSAGKIR